MKIYITRHGETKWNFEGRMQGWMNSDLTEKGINNAKKLGEHLKSIDFDLVCCSPLGRARQTAACILGEKTTPIIYNEAFKEMGFGSWEGMYHHEIEQQYPEQQYNFWNAPHLYKATDGESYEALLDRVEKGLMDLIESNSCSNVLLVTHAAVLKAILTIAYNRDIKEFWAPPFTHDTCLAIIETDNNKLRVLMEPDISHLE